MRGGLDLDAIFKLAQRLNPAIASDNFDQAIKELEYGVDLAVEVIRKGEQASHADPFVRSVLSQVAGITKRSDADAASRLIDDSIRKLAEEHKTSAEALLEAGIEQDILRRDAAAVARRVEAIAALHEEGPPAWSVVFYKRMKRFEAAGLQGGIMFHLEIMLAMAERMLAAAENPDHRGEALSYQGTALRELAQFEIGLVRLKQAFESYEAALECFPREKVPFDWALAKLNIGNVLCNIGERAEGPWFDLAIQQYQAALSEKALEESPLEWAAAQNNLGIALLQIGSRTQRTTLYLELSADAFQKALTKRTVDKYPSDWAASQDNLGNALRLLGYYKKDIGLLEEARTAYGKALQVTTRERAPFRWAKTQENLTQLFLAFFDTTGQKQRQYLMLAANSVDGALEVFREIDAGPYIAKAEGMKKHITYVLSKLV